MQVRAVEKTLRLVMAHLLRYVFNRLLLLSILSGRSPGSMNLRRMLSPDE